MGLWDYFLLNFSMLKYKITFINLNLNFLKKKKKEKDFLEREWLDVYMCNQMIGGICLLACLPASGS